MRGPATLAKLRPDLIRRHGGEGCDADDSSVSLVALVKFIVFPRGCLCWPVDVRLERLSGRRGYLDPIGRPGPPTPAGQLTDDPDLADGRVCP